MSRWEFMRQLEELLSDISPSEREEALQYYNDYFNDAGRENEQSVIEALGSPEQVAWIVKEGLNENENQGEFTENGFTSSASEESKNEVMRRTGNGSSRRDESGTGVSGNIPEYEKAVDGNPREEQRYKESAEGNSGSKKEELPTWAIVLIIIGCIVFSPVIIGVAGAILGVLAGIIVALLGLILGFGLTAVILFIVAFSLAIAGFGCMLARPLTAVGLIGGGCICAAIGILFMLLTVFIVGKCIPGICQGISYIFKSIFGKKEGEKA